MLLLLLGRLLLRRYSRRCQHTLLPPLLIHHLYLSLEKIFILSLFIYVFVKLSIYSTSFWLFWFASFSTWLIPLCWLLHLDLFLLLLCLRVLEGLLLVGHCATSIGLNDKDCLVFFEIINYAIIKFKLTV